MDGKCAGLPEDANCHIEWITSKNIVRLFRKYAVAPLVDFVSIDIDSADIWILGALLESEYKPKVLTVEFNSNIPWGFPLAFPDPSDSDHVGNLSTSQLNWDGGCFYASSAMAVVLQARKLGYVVVDLEPNLDLFLVDAQLWGRRPVPTNEMLAAVVYRPNAIQRYHRPVKDALRRVYIDYLALEQSKSVKIARQQAAVQFSKIKEQYPENACFWGLQCPVRWRVPCPHVNSYVCSSPGQHGRACDTYPPSRNLPVMWRRSQDAGPHVAAPTSDLCEVSSAGPKPD